MRRDVVLSLYSFLLSTLVLLLGLSFLLAIINLVQIIGESVNIKQMPQKLNKSRLDSDKLPKDKSKHLPLYCFRIIKTKDENLTVITACLMWNFDSDCWLRVTVNTRKISEISKQLDLDDHHLLLRCLFDALKLCKVFLEPHFAFWKN